MSVTLRPARPLDAGALGAVLHGFAAATDWLPEVLSEAEAIAHCGDLIDRGWVIVAEREGRVLAFLAHEGAAVHALYVAAAARGQGIGRALLDRAKGCAGRLELWTFEANAGARRFYAREGFVEVGRSDGASNDERLPDIRLAWPAAQPGGAAR